MKRLLAALLAIVSLSASAEVPKVDHEDYWIFSGFSYHMDKRHYWENTPTPKHYNERNYGIGFQRDDVRLVIFENSYYEPSVAAMWVPMWDLTDTLKAGMRIGGAIGYDNTPLNMPFVPVVGAELDWRVGKVHHVLGTLGYQTLTYHVQVEF